MAGACPDMTLTSAKGSFAAGMQRGERPGEAVLGDEMQGHELAEGGAGQPAHD